MQRLRTSPAIADYVVVRLALLAGVSLAVFAGPALAGQVSLQWDAVPGATGYKVYLGEQPGDYSLIEDVGGTTRASIEVPWQCAFVYSAVKAYNSAGESTEFSQEVRGWPQPEIHLWAPDILRQGDQATLSVTGANFGADTRISFLDHADAVLPRDASGTPLFVVEDFDVLDCNRLELTATVAAQARGVRAMPMGTIRPSVTLQSARGIVGRGSVEMTIQFDQQRADVNRQDPFSVGRVDGSDLSWLNFGHGSREGDPNFLADADLTGDGRIDGEDLALLSSYFGRCWTGSQWVLDEAQCT